MKARKSVQAHGASSDRFYGAVEKPKDTPIIIVLKEGVHDQHGTFGGVHQEELWRATGQAMECKLNIVQIRWARGCASPIMQLAMLSQGLVHR